MKTLLLAAISLAFVGSTAAAGPNDLFISATATVDIEDATSNASDAGVSVSDTQAARDVADDLEFERLMAEAPDEGDFGHSVIVDKTGVEIRVSGFGFNDK